MSRTEAAPPTAARTLVPAAPGRRGEAWYQDAVIYELHVRSFQDSDGDGVGDFRGLIAKLDYLKSLGVTALWLLPFYPSPLRDDGYDISDYRRVHSAYGSLRDFRTFLREAHRRGLRVITELVLAHTSDEHPWFQRARQSRPGSVHRDFYLWSDTPDRFSGVRVIFSDFESSNWTFDPVAQAYFWHRFYSHQPSLNYDNPAVEQAMFEVVDFWLGLGVDGLRLDAVPYLYNREGTSCENLPETFAFLRRLREHVDARFQDRMLLAEANQWPEDAVAYMGQGDACHMAFHFPLMPRMFMAARQEDRYPIVDILAETPNAPDGCQWALFLRNHDELTLEMVTDEERDYMYQVYARDPQARVNVGIRRRLAPLLSNDRAMIEMLNGLLFSLPGTPIVYYGDEIGMGDNIYLGDRNAVRTPMQWDSDRNAGFSRANPQRLFLPVVIDPGFHSQAVNVEAQEENPSSLLWWMRRLIGLRRQYRAFGRGSFELLRADNRKVLAFVRQDGDQVLLVVVNLSRFPQGVELDLSRWSGATPVELFGHVPFPPVGDLPYFVTLGGHGFYWFSLEHDAPSTLARPVLAAPGPWETVLDARDRGPLTGALARFLAGQRWFSQKTREIRAVSVVDVVPVPAEGSGGDGVRVRTSSVAAVVVLRVELTYGGPEHYTLTLAHAAGARAEELRRWHPEAVVADLAGPAGGDGADAGVLYDAVWEPALSRAVVETMARRRSLPGSRGRLVGVPAPALRRLRDAMGPDPVVVPISTEQSNSSVVLGQGGILKFVRRFEEGVNPGVELGRFLAERARFSHAPATGGSLVYRGDAPDAASATVAILEEFVPNEGDGWSYVVDALARDLEEALAHPDAEELRTPPPPLLGGSTTSLPSGHLLIGPHLEWSTLLGRRTAQLHLALASAPHDPDFAPVPLTPVDRQSLYHGARALVRRTFRQVAGLPEHSDTVARVLSRGEEVVDRLRALTLQPVEARQIRIHGDYHLGQVLWTGKDFVLIDFEGEPSRSLGQRRLKRPAAVDLAGMIRSFHYASRAAALRLSRDLTGSVEPEAFERWLLLWYRWVAAAFVGAYLEEVGPGSFLPADPHQLAELIDFFLLEKAVAELDYEANSRPDWIDIPALGILHILDEEP